MNSRLNVTFQPTSIALFILSCSASLAGAFSFGGPVITKLDWNTRAITAGDIDSDGRTDLALINNDTAKIDILFQRDPGAEPDRQQRSIRRSRWEPVLEDAHFVREDVVIAQYGYALAIGDLNNDGKPDIVYTGSRDPLTVRLQDEALGWRDSWTFADMTPLQWISSLDIIDIDAGGREDIVVLAEGKLLIFYMEGQYDLPQPVVYSISAQNPYGLEITDINGDGRLDVRYLSGGDEDSFRIRLQNTDSSYGPEQSIRLEVASASIKARKAIDEKSSEYIYIHSITRLVESVKLLPGGNRTNDMEKWRPVTYPSLPDGGETELFALGDFNGDALTDLVTGDSKGARIYLFLQDKFGNFEQPRSFPSFSKLSDITAGDFDGNGVSEIAVLSEDEGLVGISRLDASGRFPFPSLVPLSEGTPVAIQAADVNRDATSELLVIVEENPRQYSMDVFNRKSGRFNLLTTIPIGHNSRPPDGIIASDLNKDNFIDLIVTAPREAARILLGAKGLHWSENAQLSPLRRHQLKDLKSNAIFQAGTGDENAHHLVVAKESYARSLTMNEDDEIVVLDQYNARHSEDKVSCPLLYDLDDDGVPEVFLYEAENKELQMLKRDELGVYRYAERLDLNAGKPVEAKVIEMGADAWPHLAFFSASRFHLIPLSLEGWQAEPRGTYETDLKDVTYTDLGLGDLNADGKEDLLLLDAQNHILEILEQQEGGSWKSMLHFNIFDENLHYQGRKGAPHEPRELVIADLTNDGRDDIALLVHDRVLLYQQN